MLPFPWTETDHRGPRTPRPASGPWCGVNGALSCFPSDAGREESVHFPQAPGARSARLAYAPMRRAGAVAPAGPLRGPVPLGSHARLAAGRSLRTSFLSLRRRALAPLAWLTRLAARRRGRAGRAAARPGPARLSRPVGRLALALHFFSFAQAPGAGFFISLKRRALAPRDLAYAPGGAPARSCRPGRCAARSRSASHASGWPPGERDAVVAARSPSPPPSQARGASARRLRDMKGRRRGAG